MQNSIIECNACHAKFKLDPEALPKDPKDLTKYYVRCAECQEKIFLESLAQPELVNVHCPECHSNYAIERSKFVRPVLKARCYVCNTVFDASVHGSLTDPGTAGEAKPKTSPKPPIRPAADQQHQDPTPTVSIETKPDPASASAENPTDPAPNPFFNAPNPQPSPQSNSKADLSPSYDSSADPFAFLKDNEFEPAPPVSKEAAKKTQVQPAPTEPANYEQLLGQFGHPLDEQPAPFANPLDFDASGIEVASVDETRRLGKSSERNPKKPTSEKVSFQPKTEDLSWNKPSPKPVETKETKEALDAFSDSDAFQIGVKVDAWSHKDEELYDLSYKELDKERQNEAKKEQELTAAARENGLQLDPQRPETQQQTKEKPSQPPAGFASAKIFKDEQEERNAFRIDPAADDAYQAAIKLNNENLSSLNFIGAIPADQKYKIFKQQKNSPASFSYELPQAFKQKLSLVQFFGMNFFSPEKRGFWSSLRRFFERYYWLIIPTMISIATILTFFFWK